MLVEQVQEAYSSIARDPQSSPFCCGRLLALEVGYSSQLLDSFPEECVERFCGLSNIGDWVPLSGDEVILDLGCGAGLDSRRLAQRSSKVFAVDLSDSMLEIARRNAPNNIEWIKGFAQMIPLPDRSVDGVVVNGLLNLNPDRTIVLQEIGRVLRPGASLWGSEILLREGQAVGQSASNWFA